MTLSERTIWKCLRNKELGAKFRRQFSVGQYVLDFYCPVKKLAIEIDGEIHNDPEMIKRDKKRTGFLNKHGIKVLRFSNDMVLSDIGKVLEEIKREL